jgi:hypothetical protein
MLTRNVRLTADAHRLLSVLAASMDTSISETIETVIHEKYPHIAEAVKKTAEQSGSSESAEKDDDK